MKRTQFISALFLTTCILSTVTGISQEKGLEKSSRKQPEWLGTNVKEFIIVSSKDPNLEGARKKSIDLVRQYMVEAIAVWVESETSQEKTEENKDNSFSISEKFETKTQIQSADVPAIQGVSISKASDTYWEKVRNKKDKNEYYIFHLKYPFPDSDLNQMVEQYREYDISLSEELNTLLDSIPKSTSVEELMNFKDALNNLSQLFKDYRSEKAVLGIQQIESIIDGLRFEIIELTTQTLSFCLKSEEKVFRTSAQPKVTSDCVSMMSFKTVDKHWSIEFDSGDCYVEDKNRINLSIQTGSRRINQNVPLDISKTLVELNVQGEIQLQDVNNLVSCTMNISSEYETPFKVDKVSLEWPKHQPVFIENIDVKFKGQGLHQLEFNLEQDSLEEWQQCQKKHLCMLSGKIWFTNLNTQIQGIYYFTNISYTIE